MDASTPEDPTSGELAREAAPATSPARNGAGGALWAITSYFNPLGYRRRIENYRQFRARLGVPLAAVELGYGGRYDLGSEDADILVRIAGRDVLWQKERLLNLAVRALPRECESVAWVDGDVIFARADWPEEAARALERFALVQLFSSVGYLDRFWEPEQALDSAVRLRRRAFASVPGQGPLAESRLADAGPRELGIYAKGLAWAARRETIERHGLFDAAIIGGGDSALVHAAHGAVDSLAERQCFNPRQREYFETWAIPFGRSCDGAVTALEGDLYHLWHGELANRGLGTRHEGLRKFRFDPYSDIALDEGGGWRWSSDKPELHAYVREYFAARREDG